MTMTEPATTGNPQFSPDDLGFIQTAPTRLLAAAAQGRLDLNHLARVELASRGLDRDGVWVGFARAREIHGFDR
jgi:hypothetical protein